MLMLQVKPSKALLYQSNYSVLTSRDGSIHDLDTSKRGNFAILHFKDSSKTLKFSPFN